jgi:pimeloyl-ACP methyl ester carboxylesterase
VPNALDRSVHALMRLRGYRAVALPTPHGRLAALVFEGRGPLPPLTIVHGWAAAGVHHALVARRLKRHVRRLVLPDLPGHGFSEVAGPLTPTAMADGLRAALDALLPEPGVLLGSSFGGLAAVRYALERPERVRGLVLASPFGAPMTPDELAAFVRLLRADGLRATKGFLDRLAPRPLRRNWVFAPEMYRILHRRPLQDLLDHATETPLLGSAELGRVRVPVDVVWGRREALLPERHLDFWARLPRVRIHRFEASGHSPSYDEPERFVETVLAHLRAA